MISRYCRIIHRFSRQSRMSGGISSSLVVARPGDLHEGRHERHDHHGDVEPYGEVVDRANEASNRAGEEERDAAEREAASVGGFAGGGVSRSLARRQTLIHVGDLIRRRAPRVVERVRAAILREYVSVAYGVVERPTRALDVLRLPCVAVYSFHFIFCHY